MRGAVQSLSEMSEIRLAAPGRPPHGEAVEEGRSQQPVAGAPT